MGTAKFKFNNGNMAILCSNCDKIVKTGKDFTEQEWAAMEGKGDIKSVYCEECKKTVVDLDDVIKNPKNNFGVLKDLIPMLAENPDFKDSLVQIISERMLENIDKKKNGI